jgi:rubredoxin
MIHESGNSARELVGIEGQNVLGWGCSECSWVFNPSGPPVGESLDAMTRNYQAQLSDEFASHDCARHTSRRAKAANGLP